MTAKRNSLRIAYVTPEYVTEKNYDGGLANYLHRLALSLVQLGHRPIIVVASDRDEVIHDRGIEVHRVLVTDRRLELLNGLTYGKVMMPTFLLWQGFKLYQEVKRVHKAEPLSLIQYASFKAYGLFRLPNVPAIVRLSSYAPMWHDADGLKATWAQRQIEALEQRAYKKADALFGPSRVIANIVERAIKRPVELIETPFMLEVATLDERPYRDLLEGKRFLLFFGRINQAKGVLSIAEIIEELLQEHPSLHFVFIGKNTNYSAGSTMDYVWQKAGSCRGRVIYLGPMRHEHLYPILGRAEAVVLPSRVDNFPNTCLEAMAHKRVVIGTRGTSFEQLIADGESGFLCDVDSPQSLLQATRRALGLSARERERLGEKAYERVSRLRPEIAVDQLLNFYSQVLRHAQGEENLPYLEGSA